MREHRAQDQAPQCSSSSVPSGRNIDDMLPLLVDATPKTEIFVDKYKHDCCIAGGREGGNKYNTQMKPGSGAQGMNIMVLWC